MIFRKLFLPVSFLLLFAWTAVAEPLRVATLNCSLLFSPAAIERREIRVRALEEGEYRAKVQNLASLIVASEASAVGLQEVGSAIEARELAAAVEAKEPGSEWRAGFEAGKDTYTGENVAILLRVDGARKIGSAWRSRDLEVFSKHLIADFRVDGRRYEIVVVHAIRPIGDRGEEKHRAQIEALRRYVASRASDGLTVVVVGDFNDSSRGLLPYPVANALVDWQPTHVAGRPFDQIFATTGFASALVIRPPYGPRPNQAAISLWTDHFLLTATVK